jgi:hypothetical protein
MRRCPDPKSVKKVKVASESYRITPSGQEHIDKVAVANRSANLLPSSSTIKMPSRVPRSNSLVTVFANPFQEIRKPSEHRRFLFSIFSRNITTSSFPHLLVQFLHSAGRIADSRRKRGSALSLSVKS